MLLDVLPVCSYSEIASRVADAEVLGNLYLCDSKTIPHHVKSDVNERAVVLSVVGFVSYDFLLSQGILRGKKLLTLKSSSKASGVLLVQCL